VETDKKAKIAGEFEIWVGDKRIAKGKNMFTRYLLSTIVIIVANSVKGWGQYLGGYRHGMAWGATARVGRDTSTPTDPSMTNLVDRIDVAPSSWSRKLWRLEAEWKYMAEFLFKWDAGVLPSGTIGEFGTWLSTDNDDWDSPLVNPNRFYYHGNGDYHFFNFYTGVYGRASRLVSRIASADGKFTEFYYDNSEPLTYIWRLVVQIK